MRKEKVFEYTYRPECGEIEVHKIPNLKKNKIYTYTIKVEKSTCNFWKILIVPRNGKEMRIFHVYRSKATAEFVAKKMAGGVFKYAGN